MSVGVDERSVQESTACSREPITDVFRVDGTMSTVRLLTGSKLSNSSVGSYVLIVNNSTFSRTSVTDR